LFAAGGVEHPSDAGDGCGSFGGRGVFRCAVFIGNSGKIEAFAARGRKRANAWRDSTAVILASLSSAD
jgi:hypothetical protein